MRLLLLCCAITNASPSVAAHSLAAADADSVDRLGAGWLSTEANEFNLSMDAAEQMLFFGRSTTGDFADAQVWMARREGDVWTTPRPAAFSDPRWRHSDPWLTPDGRWLYFVSSRPAPGRGADRDDLDLWRAPVQDGIVGTLEHLAAASSTGEELGPEVHGDWLVFNSTRRGGPAPMSLYRARLLDGVPDEPEPMPAPFNDGRVQGDLTFSADGHIALFWSIRDESTEPDMFVTRKDGDSWSPAQRLPAPLNAPGMDFTPSFSADGRTLRWASQRVEDGANQRPGGGADIYAIRVDVIEGLGARAPRTSSEPPNRSRSPE